MEHFSCKINKGKISTLLAPSISNSFTSLKFRYIKVSNIFVKVNKNKVKPGNCQDTPSVQHYILYSFLLPQSRMFYSRNPELVSKNKVNVYYKIESILQSLLKLTATSSRNIDGLNSTRQGGVLDSHFTGSSRHSGLL